VARNVIWLALAIVAISFSTATTGFSASNTVPGTRVTRFVTTITADKLKPSNCSGITLTTVVAGVTGTSGNDLLLGSAAANTISGGAGNDCILGGGGNDTIACGAGTDVAIGGPGTDTFNADCETKIQ